MLIPYQVDVPMRCRPFANVGIILLTIVYYFGFQGDALTPSNATMAFVGAEEPVYDSPLILTGWHVFGMVGHTLLHAGIFHLFGNMLFLWVFGNAICAKIGQVGYVFVYAALAWMAAASFLVLDGGSAVGASGAINGIVGVFLVWYPLNSISCIYWFYIRGGTFSVSSYWMILLWLAFDTFGLVSEGGGVAYSAHVGGLVAGVALGTVLLKLRLVEMTQDERSLLDVLKQRH